MTDLSTADADAILRRQARLIEMASDAIFVRDLDGRLCSWNPAAEALYGWSVAEALGQVSHVLLRTEFPEPLEQIEATLEREGRWQGDLVQTSRDGRRVTVASRWALERDERGRPAAVLELNADVTQRRAEERERERLREHLAQLQQEFISQVSHELKHPLTPMKGYAQLMQRRHEYIEQAVTTIVAQIDHLDRIINDLLEVSRLGAGRLELRQGSVDLSALARASALAAQGMTHRHTLRVEVPAEPLVGWWDQDRLRQVFQNLLSNALKYSPDGGEIVVRVDDLGSEARVSISDPGLGIPAEALPRLFDRFYRGPLLARTRIGGLGLGLHISRALVEAHGGRLWAESAGEGEGTTFILTLPRGPALPRPPESARRSAQP